MNPSYPKDRGSFFLHRFLRLTSECNLALQIGSEAVLFLHTIVSTEDKLRYSGPVRLPAGVLAAAAGIRSKTTLLKVRKRLIDEGWLAYRAGSKAEAASYWVTVPARLSPLISEASPGGNEVQHLDLEVGPPGDEVQDQVQRVDLEAGPDPDEVQDQVQRLYPYRPNLITNSASSSARVATGRRDASAASKAVRVPRPKRFDGWDRAFAERMYGELKASRGIRKPPLDSWADEIRKLREIDQRAPPEIEAMWGWVHAHEFWSTVILSPGKLREKWDTANAQRSRDAGRRGPGPYATNGEAAGAFGEAKRVILSTPVQDEVRYRKAMAELPERTRFALRGGIATRIREMTPATEGAVRTAFCQAYETAGETNGTATHGQLAAAARGGPGASHRTGVGAPA